jgi:hypothetical protein
MPLDSDILVVSGLPRSGTSLMMQMLDRGGIATLTDGIRAADDDNPRGYYELERVKRTREDPAWVAGARGKAVKMVSALLYDLPPSETYRILFMQREIDEVLESQEKMLRRLGRPAAPRDPMKASFAVHLQRVLEWLARQGHMRVLEVSYNRLLSDPEPEVGRVSEFLDGRPATRPMLEAIHSSLYRNRKSAGGPPAPPPAA